jgi:hypothetical protein
MYDALLISFKLTHKGQDTNLHHHQIAKSSHSINAIGPVPHRTVHQCPTSVAELATEDAVTVQHSTHQ